jgi:hypothetical protein
MIMIIMGFCSVPVLIIGLFMKKGKGLMLLAGYNTMPKEARDKIDQKELSGRAGNLMLRIALALALLGGAIYLGLTWATIALLAVIIIDPCVFAVRMSRKMAKEAYAKIGSIIVIVITAIALIVVGIMLYHGEKEPVVSILDNSIRVEAMYGVDIVFSDVTAVALIEKSMKGIGVGHRDNGYGGFGETLKGHFSSDNLGDTLLFVKSGSSPTIWIEREGEKDIYISFSDGEKTRMLYRELIAAVS